MTNKEIEQNKVVLLIKTIKDKDEIINRVLSTIPKDYTFNLD